MLRHLDCKLKRVSRGVATVSVHFRACRRKQSPFDQKISAGLSKRLEKQTLAGQTAAPLGLSTA
jgi:hypothetical protein